MDVGKAESQCLASDAGPPDRSVAVSADSHVIEPHDLWVRRLPAPFRASAPVFTPHSMFEKRPGGHDPAARLVAMGQDGVDAEVLYPSLGMTIFGNDDVGLQQACFAVYNDWLAEYSAGHPGRLIGVPAISCYDIDAAIAEVERAHGMGLQGTMIWIVPDPRLPFSSAHYDPLYAHCADRSIPVSMHILTGFDHTRTRLDRFKGSDGRMSRDKALDTYRASSNMKIAGVADSLFDMLFSGVFDRFPSLKVEFVECDTGWLPFYLHRWDYYCRYDSANANRLQLALAPSEYCRRNVYFTFVDDPVGGKLLPWYGRDTWMWSTDFPHAASTWPNSREKLAENLAGLPDDLLRKVLHDTVASLYQISI